MHLWFFLHKFHSASQFAGLRTTPLPLLCRHPSRSPDGFDSCLTKKACFILNEGVQLLADSPIADFTTGTQRLGAIIDVSCCSWMHLVPHMLRANAPTWLYWGVPGRWGPIFCPSFSPPIKSSSCFTPISTCRSQCSSWCSPHSKIQSDSLLVLLVVVFTSRRSPRVGTFHRLSHKHLAISHALPLTTLPSPSIIFHCQEWHRCHLYSIQWFY